MTRLSYLNKRNKSIRSSGNDDERVLQCSVNGENRPDDEQCAEDNRDYLKTLPGRNHLGEYVSEKSNRMPEDKTVKNDQKDLNSADLS